MSVSFLSKFEQFPYENLVKNLDFKPISYIPFFMNYDKKYVFKKASNSSLQLKCPFKPL
jgi:hypothetical protein